MHTRLTVLLTVLGLTIGLAGSVWAQNRELHIPEGKSPSFNWDVKDGVGGRWVIDAYGRVSRNEAYSVAMRLTLTDGNEFSSGGNERMSEDGREVEVGPWQYGNVHVYRRVYVDEKFGYCRWIDIFENNSGEPFRLSLNYRNSMNASVNEVVTNRGAKTIEAKDWAFASLFRADANRPVVVHVIAAPNAKLKPRVQWKTGSNEVQYLHDITIEPGKAVALVFFHSQQADLAKAKAFMKSFDVSAELAKIPAPLRAILLNAPTAVSATTVERLDIPRDAKGDLAVLRNGDQIRGTITTDTFVVKTIFGEMKLPAARVVGLLLPQDEDAYAQLLLTDGQILAGDLTSSVVLKLDSDNTVTLAARDFRSAGYKLSDTKPADVKVAESFIVLRNGQRLYLADKPTLEFSTLHGRFKLGAGQLSRIVTDTPEGGLHRAMFRNGSVLSGLLTAEKLSGKLALGPTMNVSINMVAQIEFGAGDADAKPAAQITMRNEDTVSGSLAATEVSLLTDTGKQAVKFADIASAEFDPESESMEKVTLALKSGTTMSGKLQGKNLKFQIDNGPELNLFIGHIATIAINSAEEEPVEEEPTEEGTPIITPPGPPPIPAVGKSPQEAAELEAAASATIRAVNAATEKQDKIIAEMAAREARDAAIAKQAAASTAATDKPIAVTDKPAVAVANKPAAAVAVKPVDPEEVVKAARIRVDIVEKELKARQAELAAAEAKLDALDEAEDNGADVAEEVWDAVIEEMNMAEMAIASAEELLERAQVALEEAETAAAKAANEAKKAKEAEAKAAKDSKPVATSLPTTRPATPTTRPAIVIPPSTQPAATPATQPVRRVAVPVLQAAPKTATLVE